MENQFGNIVWENCGISLLNKLEKLQNRAVRVLTYIATQSAQTMAYMRVTCSNSLGGKI